jgi:hypothetical protein
MNAQTSPPSPPIADSLRAGHSGMNRIEGLLDAIWSEITGAGSTEKGVSPSGGMGYDAAQLSERTHLAADRLETIRNLLSSPNVSGNPECRT